MSWWAWMIGGAVLLGAELAFVDAQFYLVFVGTAALVVGILVTFVALEQWAQWALFAVLTIGSMAFFRGRIYRWLRGHPPEIRIGPSGGVLTLPVALAPGRAVGLSTVAASGRYATTVRCRFPPVPTCASPVSKVSRF